MNETNLPSVAIVAGYFNYPTPDLVNALKTLGSSSDIILLLSRDTDVARSIVNPFTHTTRIKHLNAALREADNKATVLSFPLRSRGYDEDARVIHVLRSVNNVLDQIAGDHSGDFDADLSLMDVTIAGFEPEEISALLGENPAWKLSKITIPDRFATQEMLFEYLLEEPIEGPFEYSAKITLRDHLDHFRRSADFTELQRELKNKIHINETYGTKETHTADAIWLYKDKILLVTRKNPPFADKLALPGGIVDEGEDFQQAAIREVSEEALPSVNGVRLTVDEITACVVSDMPYNVWDPFRDPRGYYVGHATVFDFSGYEAAPDVEGADDALEAKWVPRNWLTPSNMAFDHFALLNFAIDLQYDVDPAEAYMVENRRRNMGL